MHENLLFPTTISTWKWHYRPLWGKKRQEKGAVKCCGMLRQAVSQSPSSSTSPDLFWEERKAVPDYYPYNKEVRFQVMSDSIFTSSGSQPSQSDPVSPTVSENFRQIRLSSVGQEPQRS